MQNTTERRQLILEYLSDVRRTTLDELAAQFNVSKRTIRYDLDILTCSAPIYTVQGNGGGIRVADGWYISRRYLRDEHEAVLRRLIPGLQPEDQKAISEILLAFAKPKATQIGA